MTVFRGKKFLQIPVPAAAVKQEELAVFVIIGRKGYVIGAFSNIIKVWVSSLRACNFCKKILELIKKIVEFLMEMYNLTILEGIPKAKATIYY